VEAGVVIVTSDKLSRLSVTHEGVLPLVVSFFPLFPDWLGNSVGNCIHEALLPLVVNVFPLLPDCAGRLIPFTHALPLYVKTCVLLGVVIVTSDKLSRLSVAQEGVLPLVVSFFPLLPDWAGSSVGTTSQAGVEPLVVRILPLFPDCVGNSVGAATHEGVAPLVESNFPLFPDCVGKLLGAAEFTHALPL
jgi:hypothetical protein